jgi:hypothetical protein
MRPEFFLYKERNNFKITNFQNGANVVPAVRIGYLSKTLGPTLGVQEQRRTLARCTGNFQAQLCVPRDRAGALCEARGRVRINRVDGTGGGWVFFSIADRRVGCPLRRVGAEDLSPTPPRGSTGEGDGAGLGRDPTPLASSGTAVRLLAIAWCGR